MYLWWSMYSARGATSGRVAMARMSAQETHALRQALLGTTLYGSNGVPYRIVEWIGEGSQGLVFRALTQTSGSVVIKVIRPDRVADETLLRFRREALVMQRLSAAKPHCPHVVRFFDHAITELPAQGLGTLTLPFTVMEHVEGVTLEREIAGHQQHAFALPRAVEILRQIATALSTLHASSIIHRDLKPSNVLLEQPLATSAVRVKVMDFGLAKMLHNLDERTAYLAGASVGYAPGEQYEQGNLRVSAATDVFALAAIAYELFTGHQAFPFRPGENALAMLPRILLGARPSLLLHHARLALVLRENREILHNVDALLMQSLAAQPEHRPQSPEQFIARLNAALPAQPGLGATSQVAAAVLWSSGAMHLRSIDPAPPYFAEPPAAAPARLDFRALARGRPQLRRAVTAVFAAHGGVALVLAQEGLLLVSERITQSITALRELPTQNLNGLVAFPDHSLVLFGEGGRVVHVDAALSVASPLPLRDVSLNYTAGCVIAPSCFALLGNRGSRQFLVVFDNFGQQEYAFDLTQKIRALCVLDDRIVAVGDAGCVVVRGRGGILQSMRVCAGDLLACAPSHAGFVAVGTGGHALRFGGDLVATLERVATERDLTTVTRSQDGNHWAGASGGRVLLRTQGGWKRVDRESASPLAVVALSAQRDHVFGILSDGVPYVGAPGTHAA
jgi:eukaryotic-like serine/threonine-protein kinase